MPRAKRIYLYKFSELSDKAKQRALDHCRYWNVDHDWWDLTYEDAKTIGLELTGFDEYYAQGELCTTVAESCRLILKNHGKACETYKLAKEYRKLMAADHVTQRCLTPEYEYEESEELKEKYLKELLKLYKKMLDEEYEYLTSDEAIIESLEANEVEFDEQGREA